jgi:ABC-2 type transport system permease protein
MDAKAMADLGNTLDATLVLSSLWPFVVLALLMGWKWTVFMRRFPS